MSTVVSAKVCMKCLLPQGSLFQHNTGWKCSSLTHIKWINHKWILKEATYCVSVPPLIQSTERYNSFCFSSNMTIFNIYVSNIRIFTPLNYWLHSEQGHFVTWQNVAFIIWCTAHYYKKDKRKVCTKCQLCLKDDLIRPFKSFTLNLELLL